MRRLLRSVARLFNPPLYVPPDPYDPVRVLQDPTWTPPPRFDD